MEKWELPQSTIRLLRVYVVSTSLHMHGHFMPEYHSEANWARHFCDCRTTEPKRTLDNWADYASDGGYLLAGRFKMFDIPDLPKISV